MLESSHSSSNPVVINPPVVCSDSSMNTLTNGSTNALNVAGMINSDSSKNSVTIGLGNKLSDNSAHLLDNGNESGSANSLGFNYKYQTSANNSADIPIPNPLLPDQERRRLMSLASEMQIVINLQNHWIMVMQVYRQLQTVMTVLLIW